MPQHAAARAWLERQFRELNRVGLPWQSLLSFLRLVTNPRLFPRPEPVGSAWDVVRTWLDHPAAWIPLPTERHRQAFEQLIPGVNEANLIMDAHLAALAIEHGLILCSADTDFARFPGLRWENPLMPGAPGKS